VGPSTKVPLDYYAINSAIDSVIIVVTIAYNAMLFIIVITFYVYQNQIRKMH